MRKLTQTIQGQIFLVATLIAIILYLLRGFGLLSMMPGYILLAFIAVSVGFGIWLTFMR